MKDYAAFIDAAVRSHMDNSARSMQSDQGQLGPSDIGFCRQKAALMTQGVEATDSVPKWAAGVGTAIHTYVEAAIKEMFPDWLVGSIDSIRVTATLPSGAEISGSPDVVIPADNTVLDIKTVDGFEWIKREGTSQQHKFQRHLYALGLIAAGILTEDKPLYVGNVYFDRSGKQAVPLAVVEEIDWTLTAEVDAWITDVIYAVKNGEAASRDVPAAVCERICSHFTACRGGLDIHEGADVIEHPELISAVDMYVGGRDLEKQGKAMKDEASTRLAGVNGTTGKHQVRWVQVQPSRVESFDKQGYMRLDIRKVRAR